MRASSSHSLSSLLEFKSAGETLGSTRTYQKFYKSPRLSPLPSFDSYGPGMDLLKKVNSEFPYSRKRA